MIKWDTNRSNREVLLVVVAVSVSKSMVSTFDSVGAFHMAGTRTVPCTFSVPACAETVNSPKLTVPNGTEVRVVYILCVPWLNSFLTRNIFNTI